MGALYPFLSSYRDAIVICGTPILLLPLLFGYEGYEKQSQCAYVVGLMGSYWVFEVLPLAITALIPMVLFPFFEIMKSEDVAASYLPDTSFLFIGGLMVAVAVEKSNLHTRIALLVLKIVGSQPKWIMAGFMGVTAFLSMWISNTATAALMVPIVQSVIQELVQNHRMNDVLAMTEAAYLQNKRRSTEMRRLSTPLDTITHPTTSKNLSNIFTPKELSMAKGLLISIAFSANIGGSSTITGTASNLVLLGQLEKLFVDADTGINFLSWITFSFPMALLCLIICWTVLTIVFLKDSPKGSAIVSRKLHDKYDELEPITFNEISVMLCFFLLLTLWVFREPHFMPGFGSYFRRGFITDATSAIFVVILLFIIPDNKPMCCDEDEEDVKPRFVVRSALLDWQTVQERFPWSVVLLLGGGFALAAGVKTSQLSHEVGEMMRSLGIFSTNTIMFLCICIAVVLTNICSNTVIASIFIPIVAELARSLETNPLNFVLPVTLASSFAFLLPVATPPNAIVFGVGIVEVKDMVISGFFVTIGCIIVTMLNMVVWGQFLFTLNQFPDWAIDHSITANDTITQLLI